MHLLLFSSSLCRHYKDSSQRAECREASKVSSQQEVGLHFQPFLESKERRSDFQSGSGDDAIGRAHSVFRCPLGTDCNTDHLGCLSLALTADKIGETASECEGPSLGR